MNGNSIRLVMVVLLVASTSTRPGAAAADNDLARGFASPPPSARPWCYWWWLDGSVTRDGITRDLEAMKQQGIGGALLFDAGVGGPLVPKGRAFMSDEWRALFKFAVTEANRVGIELSINLCSGWNAGGTWVTPEHAMQKLVWTETPWKGAGLRPLAQPATVGGYYRDVAILALPAASVPLESVVNLTGKLDVEGDLAWEAPAGNWTVLRFGHTLLGSLTSCSSPGGQGFEIDPLDPRAMDAHFAATGAKLIADAAGLAGKTVTHTHIDSWECGQPTWSPALAGEFRRRRGYDLLPYLPVMAGKVVTSREVSDRFLWDLRRTVADCVADNYYGHLHTLSHRYGLGTHPESGGPFVGWHDELQNEGRNDIPMGEFWYQGGNHADFSTRQAASAAHIYGKSLCQAEAFTDMGPNWEESPFLLKTSGDRAFCNGLMRNVLCFYVHQPDENARPGYQWEAAGTHFDRHVTWWPKSHAWLDYLARCQFLLQQGRFVADLCYYYGEDVPASVPYRDQLAPKAPAGYDYDVCNTEVLLERMSVKNGRIALPDGLSYRVLVLPERAIMTPKVLAKVAELVRDGASVVGPRPLRSPSLQDYPNCDAEVNRLAAPLWDSSKVIVGKPLADVLRSAGLPPDFEGGSLAYIHRQTAAADLFFVSNPQNQPAQQACTFRVSGKQPEIWDPVSGVIRDATEYSIVDGRTRLTLDLPPAGSLFVVFRRATTRASASGRNFPPLAPLQEIAGPWMLSFDPRWGGPESVVFDTLVSWADRPEEGIRYYSGTATYRKTFDLDRPASHHGGGLLLDLGSVQNLAEVRLNGKNLGVLWTPPWRVEITGAVQPRDNVLEVQVTNLWPNRLIGDAKLPPERRLTRTNVQKFARGDHKLLPSGLLGPVRIEGTESPR